MSREGHRQLVEILQLVSDLEELKGLAKYKDTLSRRFNQSLPLIPLRCRTVSLDPPVLPSGSKLTEDVLVFNLKSFLEVFLNSESNMGKIYRGFAQRTDGYVSNPWEATWWGQSIRTTSGHCIRDDMGKPIWPSDFVWWTRQNSEEQQLGGVIWCGLDYTNNAKAAGTTGREILEVQEVHSAGALPEYAEDLSYQARFSQLGDGQEELVVFSDVMHLIEPSCVRGRLDAYLDYAFDPTSTTNPALSHNFTVRYFFSKARGRFRPTMITSPLRAEKEIATYSRQYLETYFTDTSMISLPFSLFIDAIGLYRNMYRPIMGFYLIPQFLDKRLRNRRKSLIPLTLGPFGSKFADTIECLANLAGLDEGIELTISGRRKLFVCSFINCIIGDMPSQQLLSGCLGPMANMPCRYCLIYNQERPKLDFNIVEFGRYSEQTHRNIERIKLITVKTHREQALRKLGLHSDWQLMDALSENSSHLYSVRPLLIFVCFTGAITPSLDIIRSRPIDAAHSEYQGLARQLLIVIFEDPGILTAGACEEINEVFRNFSFPPGWKRLQSPSRHLKPWRMQEFARGTIILPIILRVWLKAKHIKKELHGPLKALAKDFFSPDAFSHDVKTSRL